MKLEHYEKWEPVTGIHTPVARSLITEDHDGLVVRLMFSEIVNGLDSDLQMSFDGAPAYTVYEEFVHPWNAYEVEPPPKLDGKWKSYSFPILIVKNSIWLASFSESQLNDYPDCIHYRLVTLDQIVDVLSSQVPGVTWIRT